MHGDEVLCTSPDPFLVSCTLQLRWISPHRMSPAQVQGTEFGDEAFFDTPADLKCPLTLELFKVVYAYAACWLIRNGCVVAPTKASISAVRASISHVKGSHWHLSTGPSGECSWAYI
jgi:hypothetical protein